MYTDAEKRAASKLYSLLYNGANIYNAKNRDKNMNALHDPILRFSGIVRELNQYMKETECE
jgi:hypothetical protein